MAVSVPTQPAIRWSWERASLGVVYAVPAALVTLRDPSAGVPLAVGVLPAAIIPLPPQRRARVRVFVVGVLAGLSLLIGGVLSHLPTLLTAALLAIAVLGAAVLASTARYGMVVLALCAPLVAAGLSYTDYASAVGTFLLLSAGAAYAWIVSLAWPAREAAERARPQLPDRPAMVGYGQRMGVAAAIGYLVAVSLGLDHPGWAPPRACWWPGPRRIC